MALSHVHTALTALCSAINQQLHKLSPGDSPTYLQGRLTGNIEGLTLALSIVHTACLAKEDADPLEIAEQSVIESNEAMAQFRVIVGLPVLPGDLTRRSSNEEPN